MSLSPRLAAFLDRCVHSTDDLTVMMALVDAPDRWWDVEVVSRELGLSPSAARQVLVRLASANVLDIRVTGQVRYRLRPGTAALEEDVAQFTVACRTHAAALIQAVGSAPRNRV